MSDRPDGEPRRKRIRLLDDDDGNDELEIQNDPSSSSSNNNSFPRGDPAWREHRNVVSNLSALGGERQNEVLRTKQDESETYIGRMKYRGGAYGEPKRIAKGHLNLISGIEEHCIHFWCMCSKKRYLIKYLSSCTPHDKVN